MESGFDIVIRIRRNPQRNLFQLGSGELTLTVAWWLHEQVPNHPAAHITSAVPLIGVAGAPYDAFTRATDSLDRFNRRQHARRVAMSQHSYMVRHGMNIPKSSARHFAKAGVGRARSRAAIRFGAKLGARMIPGLGWAMLAYDVYTVSNMILD